MNSTKRCPCCGQRGAAGQTGGDNTLSLEAAERERDELRAVLRALEPQVDEPTHYGKYVFCGGALEGVWFRDEGEPGHAQDCPWLAARLTLETMTHD